MSFFEAVQTCFIAKFADFKGRATRSEYWFFVLFQIVVSMILSAIFGPDSVVVRVASAVFLVPGLAAAWRRLHDIGKSGAFWFLNLIPVVGNIIVLVFLCKPGERADNAYGPAPDIYY